MNMWVAPHATGMSCPWSTLTWVPATAREWAFDSDVVSWNPSDCRAADARSEVVLRAD
jgi:hypothetical protein